MEKSFKDYAHLYLGCEMIFEKSGRIAILSGVKNENKEFSIHDGRDWKYYDCFMFKPILRPLSDMTEEEITQFFKLKNSLDIVAVTRASCDDGFIQIEYTNSEGELYSDYQTRTFFPEQLKYLLSKSFDLFDLIPAGIAIDKTTLTHQSK